MSPSIAQKKLLPLVAFLTLIACGPKQVVNERTKKDGDISSSSNAEGTEKDSSTDSQIPGANGALPDQIPTDNGGNNSAANKNPIDAGTFKIDKLGDFPEINLAGKVTLDGKAEDFAASTIVMSKLSATKMVFFQKDGTSLVMENDNPQLKKVVTDTTNLPKDGQVLTMDNNDFWFFSEKRVSRSPFKILNRPVMDKELQDFDLSGLKHDLKGFHVLAVNPFVLLIGNDTGVLTGFIMKGTTFQVYDAVIPNSSNEKIPMLGAGLTDSGMGMWVASPDSLYVIHDVASDKTSNWGKYKIVKAATGEGTIASLSMLITDMAPATIVGKAFGSNGTAIFSQAALDLKSPAAPPIPGN